MSLSRSARTVLAAATVAAVALPLATTTAHAQGSKAPAAAPYAGLPSGTKQAKTLVIGIDGATFDAFSRADVPHIRQLMAKGLTARSNLYADPMAPTVSGAGWSSIATGVWPDKHNVKDNNFTAPDYGRYPDYATRLETADPATSTLVVGTWSPIPQIVFGARTDLRIAGGNDEGTTAKAADYLAHGNPDSAFVHLDEVDGAGHSTGSASDAYLKALNTADGRIGRLLDAVTSRPAYAQEDWLVVLTADHGHTPTGGHGGNTPLERGTFVIAQGKGIRPGSVRDDVKITDIAPTVLRHEGVATDPAWTSTAPRSPSWSRTPSTRCAPRCAPPSTRPGSRPMPRVGRTPRPRAGRSTTRGCRPVASPSGAAGPSPRTSSGPTPSAARAARRTSAPATCSRSPTPTSGTTRRTVPDSSTRPWSAPRTS
ncbi:alkaline phosphatase family protein [Streptomyces sp. NPDC018352]|uniref:alkaline phosphatase family protein n=1 Tax=Streptomyces sp. NPDC018352 TaxID=3157194 RepID=UPI0034099252